MTSRRFARRTGSAAGWIIVLIVLLALGAVVGVRIYQGQQQARQADQNKGSISPTTAPDED